MIPLLLLSIFLHSPSQLIYSASPDIFKSVIVKFILPAFKTPFCCQLYLCLLNLAENGNSSARSLKNVKKRKKKKKNSLSKLFGQVELLRFLPCVSGIFLPNLSVNLGQIQILAGRFFLQAFPTVSNPSSPTRHQPWYFVEKDWIQH